MLSRLRAGSVVKLFSVAVIDQAMLSVGNFAVGFVLIRFLTDRDYGLYVLVQSAMLLITAAQSAWLTGPLIIVAARKSAEERRSVVGAVKGSQRRVVLRAVLVTQLLPLTAYLLGQISGTMELVLAGALVSGWAVLRKEYLRSVLLLYRRPHSLAVADAVYVGVLVAGVCAATFSKSAAIVWVIAVMSVASLACGAIADRVLARDPGWVSGDAAPVLREIRSMAVWSATGALMYHFLYQGVNYVLASRLDLKAVADVNATRLLLMPVIVLTVGVQSLLIPTAAAWYAEAGLASLMRRLVGFIVGMGLLDLLYVAVMWLSRGWLIGTMLHKQISEGDELLILWSLMALIQLPRDFLLCALYALGRMKSMAGQAALCVGITLLLMWFGIDWWGAPAVLIAQIAGELVNLVGIGLMLRQAHRSSPQLDAAV
jgi:O-antigen/teichoic acid export membrane protein